VAAVLLALAPLAGGGSPEPVLGPERRHPSGAFTFRVPEAWTVRDGQRPGELEASSGELSVRFLWQKTEFGVDIAHVTCMMERPVASLGGDPETSYEYDFLGGAIGDRQVLDSAFKLKYGGPVRGHKEWRQRTLTVIGQGETLCIVSFAPAAEAKKSRRLLDAIVTSVTFPPPAPAR
jgi:hypothetical protein